MSVNNDSLDRINSEYKTPKTTPAEQTPSPTPTPNPNLTLSNDMDEVSSSLCQPLTQYEGLEYVPLTYQYLTYGDIKEHVQSYSLSDEDIRRLIGLIPWVENGFDDGYITYPNDNPCNITTDTIIRGVTVDDLNGQTCVNVGGQQRPLASFKDWKKSIDAVKAKLNTASAKNDMSQIGSERYENKNEEMYAKIYIKYIYDNIPTDTEFERIITNPANDKEKNIKQRYETVIPLFDAGIKWYETV